MKKTVLGNMRCSLARALDRMGDWWTPLIVRDVYLGVNRFDDLVEDLGISRNLLTARLKALVAAGILERRSYQERPPRHEYGLSPAGRDLVPALLALTAWGDRWAAPAEGPPMRMRHDVCGAISPARVCCGVCGGELKAEEVTILPGPGGRAEPGTRVLARRLAGSQAAAQQPG